jgi:raffinose synthase
MTLSPLAGVTAAARLSGGALPLSAKQLPPSLDVFGWCTWDAFYSTVSAKGIHDGLQSLNQGGIRPRTLIIDDGWQVRERARGARYRCLD